GNRGVLTIQNPPVHALKNAVRSGLLAASDQAKADPEIPAVVLACAGRTFVAGADITEFGKPPMTPTTGDVIATIERMGKPVIAALHGTAYGGGLEISLGCHFRVAAPGTRVGQAEIKLGIIPGAGGTQPLPRLVGLDKAFAMVVTGDPIGAQDALAHGLIDEIVQGDPTEAAIAFARKALADKRPYTPARDRPIAGDHARLDALAAPLLKRTNRQLAPAP